jgi:Anti-sigma-K factor rskA
VNREMTHDEAFAALDALAMDALDGAERDAVIEHVSTCISCREELASLRATAAQLAYAATPSIGAAGASRARIRSRLMARAQAENESIRERSLLVSSLAWRRAEWMAAAAGILLVASVAVLAFVLRDRQALRDALTGQAARVAAAQRTADSLRGAMLSRDSMLAAITGRDVAVMTLTKSGANAPFARMFWDKAKNTWTFVAHDMPDLRPGRTYQLWLVTAAGAKVSAGTFDPQGGEAVVRATYPLARDSLSAVAVTEEAAGGAQQPTSPPIIAVSAAAGGGTK